VLLRKAALLADKLLPVFDSPSSLPYYGVRTSGPAPVYETDDPKSYKYGEWDGGFDSVAEGSTITMLTCLVFFLLP
jgi:hypothetical protein